MTIVVKLGIFFLNLLYGFMKLFPQGEKITIISRQGDSPSPDIEMLAEAISREHPDYQVVVLCKKIHPGVAAKVGYCFHILSQMRHIATSRAVILDSYCIAASVLRHRKSLLIIQMWHSIGTMKKFGYSVLDKPEGSSSRVASLMKMHANYDYILASGDGYREHLAQGFNYPLSKIVTMPLPRVERLKDEAYRSDVSARIFARYPQLAEKKNIVYVPTFRKVNDKDFLRALGEFCDAVDYEEFNLVVKVHPLTDISGFDGGQAVVDSDFSSFDMLFVSDAVVSDYSCIIYEAAILEKPVYFYTYDYEEYMGSRDIYMDFKKEVPGPICRNGRELWAALRDDDYDFARLKGFLNKYVYVGSNHETKDIVDFVFEHFK